MILDVPYQSQEPLETTKKRRWCSIASLWMVMSYYLKDATPKAEELLEKYGQLLEERGFAHKDFLKIARDFGLKGFRKSWWAKPGSEPLLEKFREEGESEEEISEWEKTNLEEGIFTIKSYIDKNIPVIVSVSPQFSPSNSTHIIVVVGYEEDNLIVHDPYKKGANFKVSVEDFKKYWLKQAIIINNTLSS